MHLRRILLCMGVLCKRKIKLS